MRKKWIADSAHEHERAHIKLSDPENADSTVKKALQAYLGICGQFQPSNPSMGPWNKLDRRPTREAKMRSWADSSLSDQV
ncbi:hypothetical protein FQN55_006223 [Onygenales sp. PD_40]|nr:hypothetical protein FQN55_006223 [Onygenales sp. PD_40]